MTLRVNMLVTHLRPEDAYVLIETLDQLRDTLMQTYGDEIRVMLQEASSETSRDEGDDEIDRDPF